MKMEKHDYLMLLDDVLEERIKIRNTLENRTLMNKIIEFCSLKEKSRIEKIKDRYDLLSIILLYTKYIEVYSLEDKLRLYDSDLTEGQSELQFSPIGSTSDKLNEYRKTKTKFIEVPVINPSYKAK